VPTDPANLGLPEHPVLPPTTTRTDTSRTRALVAAAQRLLPGWTVGPVYELSDGTDWWVDANFSAPGGSTMTTEVSVGSYYPDRLNHSGPGVLTSVNNLAKTYARTAKGHQVTLTMRNPARTPAPSMKDVLAAARPATPNWASSPPDLASSLTGIGDAVDGQ
jgi:hypothetical protein